MLKRFLAYYKPHKKIFVADMIAALLVSVIGVFYPVITRTMLNDLIPHRNYRLILIFGLTLLSLYLLRMLLNFFIQYYGHVMGVRMQAQMRSDMFNHLEKLPFSYFDDHETGKIMSRMTNDLMDVSELAHHGPENLIISSVSIVISFIYLSTINVWLTLLIFACTPLLLIVSLTLRRRMRHAFQESRKAVGAINAALESSITGIRVTKAYTNEQRESEKFEVGNGQFVNSRRAAYKAMGQFHSANTFITDVFNVVVLIAGGFFLYNGQINFGDYSAFIVSVNLFISPVMTLINFIEQYESGVTGFSRFLEVMDAVPEQDEENAVELDRAGGEILLQSISSTYDGKREILKDVSLHVPKGKTLALVGASGGGKTTVCHLIPRFYEIEKGNILLDGTDIRRFTRASLRRNIGIVAQDVFLFNGSIRENILYGRPGASEEEVIAAARRANIHDYVMTLEKGYDTEIGERGVRLSGGQKQRLSIARVFLKDPAILILDEATSALDNATEILIQDALNDLCRGRTTIVVAHRLSTVQNADEIAVIEDGRVAERGTHETLLEKDGIYANLHRGQFRTTPFSNES